MPKTMTFDVPAQRLVREALLAKRKLLERSLDGKRARWAQEQIERLDEILTELNKPVMVTRVNLMSGQEYQEAEDTPGFCSPASEAYWSM